jgi:hypothetical protein
MATSGEMKWPSARRSDVRLWGMSSDDDTPAIMWLPDLAALILAVAANSPKPTGSHLAQ